VSDDIEEIYDGLLDDNPKKPGTKYERLMAMVAQILDETAVVEHDVRLRGEGLQTAHQIDVRVITAAGQSRTILFECRDYDTDPVDLDQVRSFATVKRQLQPDAAWMVTTVRFTKGAITCAADEGVNLAILRSATQDDVSKVIRKVVLTQIFREVDPTVRIVNLRWTPTSLAALRAAALGGQQLDLAYVGDDRVADVDGLPAETWRELFARVLPTLDLEVGRHSATAPLEPPRSVEISGVRAAFDEMTFEYELRETSEVQTIEATGAAAAGIAELVLISVQGEELPTRVIYREDLGNLGFDEDGRVALKDH